MSDPQLDPCGCCEPTLPEPSVENTPGQPSLAYRIAPHGEALRRMVARLPRWTLPDGEHAGQRPLQSLTTRATDDPAVALLDAWAVATDVLSFYQERIANEGFLRTATERRSVLELARAIGYELNPGVAASTFLAFTVDDSPGAPGEATIPAGTQVQSLPTAAGALPQTFETSADFTAYVEWNALRPRLTEPQLVDLSSVGTLYLEGTALALKAGSALLLVRPDEAGNAGAYAIATVRRAEVDSDHDRTVVEVTLRRPAPTDAPPARNQRGAERPTAAPPSSEPLPFTAANAEALIFSGELTESELQAILNTNSWEADALLRYANEERVAPTGSVQPYAMRERLAFFGHNAPRWETLPTPDETRGDSTSDPYALPWDGVYARTIWTDSQGNDYEDEGEADAFLERTLADLLPDSWAVVAGRTRAGETRWEAFQIEEVSEASLADYAISGKATGLTLRYADGRAVVGPGESFDPQKGEQVAIQKGARGLRALDRSRESRVSARRGQRDPRPGFLVRRTTAHVKSEPLALAPQPLTDPIPAASTALLLDRMVIGLRVGQPVALTGEQVDAPGTTRTETLFLKRITHKDGRTTLEFNEGLRYGYVRESVMLNANVVAATHGETVASEVLGSGNGAVANQRFTLKKPPLTHVSAPTASGAASTLRVRVNRVEWGQRDSLYGETPTSEAYTVRLDDDANATVLFGDGQQGARLPTGQENVVATYRSGIGRVGEVAADTVTLLKTRPFGVRSVTNPQAATGAADPETLAAARANAPLTVMTLDRIVSLRDFEDFARSFAGIGKARAVSLWRGEHQRVHLTIADEDGEAVPTSSALYQNLVAAIAAARDPLREVEVESFTPRFFNVGAKVLRDPAYLWEDVAANVEAALRAAFAFEQRAFGQPVTSAEVLTVIHTVAGVIAVDLDALHLVDSTGSQVGPTRSEILPARLARYDATTQDILPAQLLLLNEAGVELVEMQ